jgi:hypothetical protein
MTMQSEKQSEPSGGRRVMVQVSSLDSVVGAHPDALREMYEAGKPADPAELGDTPRLRLLALAPLTGVHMAARPFVQALASGWAPVSGKEFDHGGNSGMNIVFGKKVCRFRAEVVPSELDGRPALALTYSDKAFGNPWPVSAMKDELRAVASGIALGPAFLAWRGSQILVLWFGLERVPPA